MRERRYPPEVCPCCGASTWRQRPPTGVRCLDCGVEIADPTWLSRVDSQQIDHVARQMGLSSLRSAAADRILKLITQDVVLSGLHILDVGCGYGWFLKAAVRNGMRAVGMEPDPEAATRAKEIAEVIEGSFPNDLAGDRSFDLIVFNDVLEHIAGPDKIMAAARMRLNPMGRVVVVCPDSIGILYTMARLLATLGLGFALDRLWQRGFPSPHLYYFNYEAVQMLARRTGYNIVRSSVLPSMTLDGLGERIRMVGPLSQIRNLILCALMFAAYIPVRFVERLGRPDIRLYVLRAADDGGN